MTSIGERIRAARINAGLTQAQLAAELHWHPKTVYRYETGRLEVKPRAVAKLSEVLGVDLMWSDMPVEDPRLPQPCTPDSLTKLSPCSGCRYDATCYKKCTLWRVWFRAAWAETCAPFRSAGKEHRVVIRGKGANPDGPI